MFKACSRCGKIHDTRFKCTAGISRKPLFNPPSKLRNSNEWHKKSEEIRKASRYLCAVCEDMGIYTYANLEVHHIEALSEAPDKLLDNSNLICLCAIHHRAADRGELDQDYLRKLAESREAQEHPPYHPRRSKNFRFNVTRHLTIQKQRFSYVFLEKGHIIRKKLEKVSKRKEKL